MTDGERFIRALVAHGVPERHPRLAGIAAKEPMTRAGIVEHLTPHEGAGRLAGLMSSTHQFNLAMHYGDIIKADPSRPFADAMVEWLLGGEPAPRGDQSHAMDPATLAAICEAMDGSTLEDQRAVMDTITSRSRAASPRAAAS